MSVAQKGGGVQLPIFLFLAGGVLLVSAFQGESIVDVLAGVKNGALNPAGYQSSEDAINSGTVGASPSGTANSSSPAQQLTGTNWTAPTGGAHSFKGPNAKLLNQLASYAQNQCDLTITATTNGNHVPGSWHYKGRAFDASGSESNMKKFADYCMSIHTQLLELIHNPGYGVKNGQVVNGAVVFAAVWLGHKDHVHVAA